MESPFKVTVSVRLFISHFHFSLPSESDDLSSDEEDDSDLEAIARKSDILHINSWTLITCICLPVPRHQ